jgi:serine protease AprX
MKRKQCWSAVWGGVMKTNSRLSQLLGTEGEPADRVASKFRYVALLCLVLAANVAFGKSPKVSKDLQDVPAGQSVDVIVQYRVNPGQAHFDRVKARGGSVKRDLRGAIHGAAFTVNSNSLSDLADDPDVAYISPDRPLGSTSVTSDFYDQAVLAPYGWSLGYDGSGIGVAVVDSGITNNGDLTQANFYGSRIVYAQNFVTQGATGIYGHGTHVAGIVAGNGKNSTGWNFFRTFAGIAQNANIVDLKVLDGNGSGTDSQVIAGIQQAINLKSTYNIRVINLSLGRPVYESYKLDPLCQAVESAWKAGIVVVVAAGNEGRNNSAGTNGYGTITAPGNDPYVITVGAMRPMGTADRSDDLIASYSSKGPTLYDHIVKPDIVAPGNQVISTLASTNAAIVSLFPQNAVATNTYNYNGSGSVSSYYFTLSGTSMATPVVSGAAALLLQQNAWLTPDQVKARLMKSAYKVFPRSSSVTDPTTGITYTSQYDIFTVGAGYLDLQAALSSLDLASSSVGSAQSPAVALDSSGNVYLVKSSSVVWGNSVLWGSSVVWGTSVIWGTNVSGQSVLWGSSVCWGSSTNQAYSVIWGSSVVWGTSSTTEDELVSITGE